MKIAGANLIDFYVLINRGEITKMSPVPQSGGWFVLKEKMAVLLVWLYSWVRKIFRVWDLRQLFPVNGGWKS